VVHPPSAIAGSRLARFNWLLCADILRGGGLRPDLPSSRAQRAAPGLLERATARLLPRWRGAAPIQWSLLKATPKTALGIMAMEEGLEPPAGVTEKRLTIGTCSENAQPTGTFRLSKAQPPSCVFGHGP